MSQLEVDEKRIRALARHDAQVVRLEDQLAEYVKLIAHALECLRAELFDGLGYKKLSVDDKVLRKLKDLGASFNSATDAQVRLDKTAREREKAMTPEEELDAVRRYIMSRDDATRGNFLRYMIRRHREITGRPFQDVDADPAA